MIERVVSCCVHPMIAAECIKRFNAKWVIECISPDSIRVQSEYSYRTTRSMVFTYMLAQGQSGLRK